MRKGAAVVISLLLAGAVGGGSFYQFIYRDNKVQSGGRVSSQSEDAVYVDSVKMLAGLGDGSGVLQRFAGVVEPQQTWSAKLEGEKTVKETFVKEGDSVKVGDKLFSYDTAEDEEKLAKDEIEQERSENEIAASKQRIEQLEKEKARAKQEDQLSYTTSILQEENTIKTEEYDIKTRELEMSQLKESIEHSDVLSELEGVVQTVAKLTDSGNGGSALADSSSEAYITIMEVGDYRIRGTVNEQNINEIYQEEPMIVYSRVDDQFWNGQITEIRTGNGQENKNTSSMWDTSDSDSSTSSTNYSFYVGLDSSDGLLLGQHVYLEADVGQTQKRSGIWLPAYYFIGAQESAQAVVWAASEKDVLEKRTVLLGSYDGELDLWEVEEGLTGEDYITVPGDFLEEGLPVIYMDQTDVAPLDGGMFGEDLFQNGDLFAGSLDDWDEDYWDEDDWDEDDWDEDEDWSEEDGGLVGSDWEETTEDWEDWISWEEWTEEIQETEGS